MLESRDGNFNYNLTLNSLELANTSYRCLGCDSGYKIRRERRLVLCVILNVENTLLFCLLSDIVKIISEFKDLYLSEVKSSLFK